MNCSKATPTEPCYGESLAYENGTPVCEGHFDAVYRPLPDIEILYNFNKTRVIGQHCRVCGTSWGRNFVPDYPNHLASCIYQTDRAHYVIEPYRPKIIQDLGQNSHQPENGVTPGPVLVEGTPVPVLDVT